ncbi:hypothetical protein ACU610_15765 [Geodermatophilus sp. URMC 61]|uniref:hypothetical protein n=1 Tax=Geodermatophilus sp. URMC 61 TaxID=3423411 RepID=UPI00406CFDB2
MSRKTRRSRRGPVLVLATLLLAVGALVLWTRSGDTAPAAAGTPPVTTPASTSPPAGTSPPAVPSSSAPVADTAEGEAEEDVVQAPSSPTAAPAHDEDAGGLAAVAVSLSYTGYDAAAAAVVAGGYAAGIVEEDATCTLVLRREGVELRGESLGAPSAATTDCGEVRVGGDALTSGTWEAVLSYTSETSVGESAAVEVEVP